MAKVGDPVEVAIWLTGTESIEMLKQWKADVGYLLARSQGEPVLKLGPVLFELKKPGEDRVPAVPDHISGPDVRLLVAWAEVVGFETVARGSFLSELSPPDLERLRRTTRKMYAGSNPRAPRLSDDTVDRMIEQMGPVAAGVEAKRAVNGGLLH